MTEPASPLRLALRIPWLALTLAISLGIFGGCERSQSYRTTGRAPDPKQTHSPDQESDSRLVVLTWEEYLLPEVLERFEEESGVQIEYRTIGSSDQFAQLLASEPGTFDVVVVDDKTLIDLKELDLLQPLDASLIQNMENLDPRFLGRDFDPKNSLSIPYLWGTTLIAYRKDHVPDPPSSWRFLLDGRLKNRLALLDEPDDLLMIALYALGNPPNDADEFALEEATDLLLMHLDHHDGEMWELYEALDALDRGEISATITYSGDAVAYAEENEQIGYYLPEEGAPLWIDSFAICRTSPNSKKAHQFIEFMIEAEIAATNANGLHLATPNRAATPLIDESLLLDPAIYPPDETMNRCEFIRLNSPENVQAVNRSIRRIYDHPRGRPKTAASFEPLPAGTPRAVTEPAEDQ